jgi:hypothetical protein
MNLDDFEKTVNGPNFNKSSFDTMIHSPKFCELFLFAKKMMNNPVFYEKNKKCSVRVLNHGTKEQRKLFLKNGLIDFEEILCNKEYHEYLTHPEIIDVTKKNG